MAYTELQTARGTFGVRQHGSHGPQVICLHGFPDDASTYDTLAADLAAAGHRVTAVNLRGYAPSTVQGPLDMDTLVDDLLTIAEQLSPHEPIHFIGHDYGAQLAYPAMARSPYRFASAVLFAGAHPAYVQRNARRSLRQLWASRYIIFFQLGGFADRRVARDDFAYVDSLWRRWAPAFTPPAAHLTHVKRTLAASMPAPVAMYRASGFSVPPHPIAVPTLYITGDNDGCALPHLAAGQEALFTARYQPETWTNTGHFPHLEQPGRAAKATLDWISQHT
jgi:pimeloyl-ACP methyl ester carboxylesterase